MPRCCVKRVVAATGEGITRRQMKRWPRFAMSFSVQAACRVHRPKKWRYHMRNLPLNLINQALDEDGAWSDITTLSAVPETQQAQASIITRQAGVIAGLNVAAATFRLLDDTIVIELLVQDGAAVQPGQIVASLSGS